MFLDRISNSFLSWPLLAKLWLRRILSIWSLMAVGSIGSAKQQWSYSKNDNTRHCKELVSISDSIGTQAKSKENRLCRMVSSWNRRECWSGERRSLALAIARVLQKGKGRMEHPASNGNPSNGCGGQI